MLLSCAVCSLRRLRVRRAGGGLREQLLTWAQAAVGTPRPARRPKRALGNLLPAASAAHAQPSKGDREPLAGPTPGETLPSPPSACAQVPTPPSPLQISSPHESLWGQGLLLCRGCRSPGCHTGFVTHEKTTERPRGRGTDSYRPPDSDHG